MTGRRRLLCACLVAAPATAGAHGGLNQSEGVVPTAGGPVVVSEYGLVRQAEDGVWEWVCEEVMGRGAAAWSFSVDPASGRWTLAGIDGVHHSDGGCDWTLPDNALAGVYVTAVLADSGRGGLWALTGTAEAENPLWWSSDGAETWAEGPLLHPTARLRSAVVEPDGRLWVQGMVGEDVVVWTSPDGEDWVEIALQSDTLGGRVEAAAGGRAWVIVRYPDGDEGLHWVEPDGGHGERLHMEQLTAAGAGPGRDEVWVGGSSVGAQRSLDGGASWQTVDELGVARCFAHDGQTRWVCTDNWSEGAAVRQAPLNGSGGWDDTLWFGDVRRAASCGPETTASQACGALWDELSDESGFDQQRDIARSPALGAPEATGCGGGAAIALWGLLTLGWASRPRRSGPAPTG